MLYIRPNGESELVTGDCSDMVQRVRAARETRIALMAAICTALMAAVLPAGALAFSSGEITRATTMPDWGSASLAGIAERTHYCDHEEGPEPPAGGTGESPPPRQPESAPWACGWIPYVTLGPGSSQSDCAAPTRRLGTLGPGVQLVWLGPELKGPGSVAFDLRDVGLEHGAAAPLACLSVVEAVREDVICPEDGSPCPPYAIVHRHDQLDSALVEVTSSTQNAAGSGPNTLDPPPCRRARQGIRRPQRRHKGALVARVSRSKVAKRGRGARARLCGKRAQASR